MNKVYHLESCSTCRKILKETGILARAQRGLFTLQDIKKEKLTSEDVDMLRSLAGSYEKLFSRRAIKYREWGLQDKTLAESDYRHYLLEDYTFLKRPVIIIGKSLFIGNDKATLERVKVALK